MNLLITNTQAPQSYDLIRALRPYFKKIVVSMEGDNRVRSRLIPSVNSRFINKRYYTNAPTDDWLAGKVQAANTAKEEEFIQSIIEICKKEEISFIYPSWDPYIYLFSKNIARFKSIGVTIPIPDFSIIINTIDKYRTLQAAAAVGVPVPRTYLYDQDLDLKEVIVKEGFPLIVKPRFTSGGKGMMIINSEAELREKLPQIAAEHEHPIIQEYIPGGEVSSVQFVIDQRGETKFIFHKRRLRKLRLLARYCTVSQSAKVEPYVDKLVALLNYIGWWGAGGIETMRDPRDGVEKLMEINPRYPPQVWNRLEMGINEPWACVKIAQGEIIPPLGDYPLDILFVSPVDDLQLLMLELLDRCTYKFRTKILRRPVLDSFCMPEPLTKHFQNFLQTYFGKERKVIDPYTKNVFTDPLVSVLRWLQFGSWLAGGLKKIGR